jgi:predicted mannosyl-3-phosphoglycerate phosphatase (HAD superfamily)
MTKAEQFREYAEAAMQWSRQSRTEEAKKVLVDLAFTWMKAAALRERNIVSLSEQRV